MNHDPINHPSYYDHPSRADIECIDIIEWFPFNVGAAIKYLWRAGRKNPDAITDLKKARWYIERELVRLGGK